MMKTVIDKIVDHNNLYWAWEKAKNFYKPGDIWFSELEVSAFEADLSGQLSSIIDDILTGKYKMSAILPIAYPKSADEDGPRTRQTFWVSVRDQVTWLAVCNIIGPHLDSRMPFWSYGNRLYISTFFSAKEGLDGSNFKFGYYRNTTKNTFRKWKQSWPLYRRHIHLTSQYLTKEREDFFSELDIQDQEVLFSNDLLVDHPLRALYLEDDYWQGRIKDGLFWAGLDLTKFYPNLNIRKIHKNILEYLPDSISCREIDLLINSLLDFEIDCTGWTDAELSLVGINSEKGDYPHLPTGLFVAGFLANVALLHVDDKVSDVLRRNKNVAHFRYVDDHVILATTFDQLVAWIDFYTALLEESDIGTTFNSDKTEPLELRRYLSSRDGNLGNSEDIKDLAERQTALDPDFPSPLMTKTLGKVSKIAGTAFDLLTPAQESDLVDDIEHLLVTEFPDEELPKDTRVSFAASMLSSIVPKIKKNSNQAYQLHKNICIIDASIQNVEADLAKNKGVKFRSERKKELKELAKNRRKYTEELIREKERLDEAERALVTRTSKLLLKSIQENHDKVRLWGRLIEFFLRTGVGKPKLIFAEIEKLIKRSDVNVLSLTFIHAYILQILTNTIFSAINILRSDDRSARSKSKAKKYLINILEANTFLYFERVIEDKSKFYELVSFQSFKFAAGMAITAIEEGVLFDGPEIDTSLIKRFSLLNIHERPESFFTKSKYQAGTWCWWYFNKLPLGFRPLKPYYWSQISSLLDYRNIVDLNAFLLHSNHASKRQIRELSQSGNDLLFVNEGVLFEFYKKYGEVFSSGVPMLKGVVAKCESLKTFLSLSEWIDWMVDRQLVISSNKNGNQRFDPRLGEWMALEITKLVAVHLIARIDMDDIPYYKYLHPNNFRIPCNWATSEVNEWGGLFEMIEKGKKSVTLRSKESFIMDSRLVPQLVKEKGAIGQAYVQGLGTLLVALLSKNIDLPSGWTPIGLQQARLSLVKLKLKDLTISSYTNDLLSGCFSKRNIETLFEIKLDQVAFKYDDDTEFDPPLIDSLQSLVSLLEFAQGKLRMQQLSVSNQQPRQLTPISLVKMRRDVYQNEINSDEIGWNE